MKVFFDFGCMYEPLK